MLHIVKPRATLFTSSTFGCRQLCVTQCSKILLTRRRYHGATRVGSDAQVLPGTSQADKTDTSLLARLPMSTIIRSLLLGSIFRYPSLSTVGVSFMKKLTAARWKILSPDKNAVLNAIIKSLIYNQFCAGTTPNEIQKTKSRIKSLGFSGIILCYGKEIQVQTSGVNGTKLVESVRATMEAEVNTWKDGNLNTLDMVGTGDFLGIKYAPGTTISREFALNCATDSQVLGKL